MGRNTEHGFIKYLRNFKLFHSFGFSEPEPEPNPSCMPRPARFRLAGLLRHGTNPIYAWKSIPLLYCMFGM